MWRRTSLMTTFWDQRETQGESLLGILDIADPHLALPQPGFSDTALASSVLVRWTPRLFHWKHLRRNDLGNHDQTVVGVRADLLRCLGSISSEDTSMTMGTVPLPRQHRRCRRCSSDARTSEEILPHWATWGSRRDVVGVAPVASVERRRERTSHRPARHRCRLGASIRE